MTRNYNKKFPFVLFLFALHLLTPLIRQVVYGLVYGIGAKSLGEQLGVGEDEAFKFMENFKVFFNIFVFAVLAFNRLSTYIFTFLDNLAVSEF